MQVKCYVTPLPKINPELLAHNATNWPMSSESSRSRTFPAFHFSSRLQNLKNKSHLHEVCFAGKGSRTNIRHIRSEVHTHTNTHRHTHRTRVPGEHTGLPVMEWTLFAAVAGAGGNASLSTLWHICQSMCSAYKSESSILNLVVL